MSLRFWRLDQIPEAQSEPVTHADLDELVRQARRDGPALSLLSSVARSLHVPFVKAPLAAVVVREAPATLPNAKKMACK